MYRCRHFDIEELVEPEILEVITEEACWRLIPPEVVWSLDLLRDMYGLPISINGRGLTACGIRSKNSSTGAKLSGHKLYRGETCFDFHCSDLKKLEGIIRAEYVALGIGRMENPSKTKGWLHISFIKGAQVLEIFNP